MKHTPRLIIYLSVINYLSKDEIENLKKELGSSPLKQDRKFIRIIKAHFDIEQFSTKPFIWQDIWIYNYLQYEVKSRLPRRGLIAKYEKEIILPMNLMLNDLREIINLLNSAN